MFLDYYGLHEQPFGVTPNPQRVYPSRAHREALASLSYAVRAGLGFSALIAEAGMGKTTTLFKLRDELRESAHFAFIFQTQCNSREFMRSLLIDLRIDAPGDDLVDMHERLKDFLLRTAARRHVVLIVDEAQNLKPAVLETIRLLSDFETAERKLLHIIMAGQPPLADLLAKPELVQVRQRIQILARIDPLSSEECAEYIDFRMRMAGYQGDAIFSEAACKLIARASQGIPRNINRICFNALSLGYALNARLLGEAIVSSVLADFDLKALGWESRRKRAGQNVAPAAQQETARKASAELSADSLSEERMPKVSEIGSRHVFVPSQPAISPISSGTRWSAAQPFPPVIGQTALQELSPEPGPQPVPPMPSLIDEAPPIASKPVWPQREDRSSQEAWEAKRPMHPAEDKATAAAGVNPQSPAASSGRAAAATPAFATLDSRRASLRGGGRGKSSRIAAATVVLLAVMSVLAWADWQKDFEYSHRLWELVGGSHLSGAVTAPAPESAPARPAAEESTTPVPVVAETRPASDDTRPNLRPGRLIHRVDPQYPRAALRAGAQGTVVLLAKVAPDGHIASVRAVSVSGNTTAVDNSEFVKAAQEAVRQWRYEPARLNGRPVSNEVQVRLVFALPGQQAKQ